MLADGCEEKKIDTVVNATNFYKADYSDDRELQLELNKLIIESVKPQTSKTITVQYNNILILIPITTAISSRLSSLFWSPSLVYEQRNLPYYEVYNEFLANIQTHMVDNKYPDGVDISETIAIFGATYKKNMVSLGGNDFNAKNDENSFKRCNTGVYNYYDFAVVIVKNGRVIDYAIHGYASNISEAIDQHKPVRVYYNATLNDALDVFLRYPYQPFYSAVYDKLSPVKIAVNENFNILPFCERRAPFCAICNCLKVLRSIMFTTKSNLVTVKPWEIQNFKKSDRTRQPNYNARQRRLKYATKQFTSRKPISGAVSKNPFRIKNHDMYFKH